jgi:hypothetical protein
MVPELSVAMLACARIGVTHSVVAGSFSASERRNDPDVRRSPRLSAYELRVTTLMDKLVIHQLRNS